MALTSLARYTPVFNQENGKYEDRCPIPPRERITHSCLCGAKPFSTPTEFKSHITRKSHERFVANYVEYIRDTEDLKKHVTHLQAHFELSVRKYQQEIRQLKDELAREKEKNHVEEFDMMRLD
jgi:hypothetical protein